MYGDSARLVVSHDDMTQILQCTSDWKDIGDTVDRVCSTKLGFGMFAWAQQHVTAAKLSELMAEHIAKLASLASIGENEVSEAKQAINERADMLVGISGLPSRSDGHSPQPRDHIQGPGINLLRGLSEADIVPRNCEPVWGCTIPQASWLSGVPGGSCSLAHRASVGRIMPGACMADSIFGPPMGRIPDIISWASDVPQASCAVPPA